MLGLQESLSAAIRPNGPAEAVLLFQWTGKPVASWMREPHASDVLTIMAATAQGSVDTLVEALGEVTPREILLSTDRCSMLIRKLSGQLSLLVIVPATVALEALRVETRRLADAVSAPSQLRTQADVARRGEAVDRIPVRAR